MEGPLKYSIVRNIQKTQLHHTGGCNFCFFTAFKLSIFSSLCAFKSLSKQEWKTIGHQLFIKKKKSSNLLGKLVTFCSISCLANIWNPEVSQMCWQ